MSREILFRGKRVGNTEWVFGYVYYGFNSEYISQGFDDVPERCYHISDFNGNIKEVHSETIGQYTGREDKNMNKIFEGDIVLSPMGNKMIVFWSEKYCSFGLKSQDWAFVHWFGEAVEPEECKIIGNIHEKHL